MVEASLQPLCKGFALTRSQPGKGFSSGFLQKTLSFSTRYFQQLQQKAFKIGDQNIWVCHQVLSGYRTTSTFIAQSWHSLGFFASIHSWKNLSLIIRKNLHSLPQISETTLNDTSLFATDFWNNAEGHARPVAAARQLKQAASSKHAPKKYLCFNAPCIFVPMFSWKIEIMQLSSHPPQLLFWSFLKKFLKIWYFFWKNWLHRYTKIIDNFWTQNIFHFFSKIWKTL